MKSLSCVGLFATPWSVAYQAPPSMEFSKQESWSELPFPSPEYLLDPGMEPRSPALQTDALPSEPPGKLAAHMKFFINICLKTLKEKNYQLCHFWGLYFMDKVQKKQQFYFQSLILLL